MTGNTFQASGKRLALIAVAALWAGSLMGQSVNPLEGDARAILAGGSLFRAQCATCHGPDGVGIESIDAPDLTTMWNRRGVTDRSVFATIRDGVPGSIMPPHAYTDTELWMLVAWLRSVAASGAAAAIEGDGIRGGMLFRDNCARCHQARGQGGALGPSLSGITRRRSLDALVNSVRQPGAVMARGYKPVSLLTADNERVRGVIKSEDAFSVQIMDLEQVLRGFAKSDLRELRREQLSLMPPFPVETLSDDELMDLLSYLQADTGE